MRDALAPGGASDPADNPASTSEPLEPAPQVAPRPASPTSTAPGPATAPPEPAAPGARPAAGPSVPLRVLVAYASKAGSTREVGEAIGAELARNGLAADVRPAPEVRSIEEYAAVILGSGLYAATWLKDANRFVRVHRAALANRPVWLFSSGPLDRSADFTDIPITPHVVQVLRDLPIRGHRTFGGRLLPDAPEVLAGVIARYRVGDFRDFEAIRSWAAGIARALG